MERLLVPALGLWMLCACASVQVAAPVTPAQVPADLTGVTMMLLRVQPLIVYMKPGAFTAAQRKQMEADINKALLAVRQLSAGMPLDRGIALAREADIPLSRTLDILGAVVPVQPALTRWAPVIDAIDAVLPAVEKFVDGSTPEIRPAVTRGRRTPAMTPDQGRLALGIRITP